MPKHEPLTAKAIGNRIKAKGLQRLRWYCQMCEKQCRDQNGFKCHCMSESHQRQMAIFAQNPRRYVEQFSQEFEAVFLSILSRRYGTKQVLANLVYQEIVADRQHLHMNATRWDTLTDFVVYLGKAGKCRVEDTDNGWAIAWIDNSPEALARKAAILKKERQEMGDEQQEQKLLQEQIKRAQKAQTSSSSSSSLSSTALKRDSKNQPIKLAWKTKSPLTKVSKKGASVFKPKASNPFKTSSSISSAKKK